ncbi:MAG: DUF4864 domain-containing protein [Paracoccaceae bacterium]
MRGHVFAVLLSLFCWPAFADEPRNPDIEATISNQLNAFIADDFARAFTFASPNIKGIFGTPENFGAMVTQGYPMVHRPANVQMLELREVAGNLWQRVLITDAAGETHLLDYQMIETPDGWQINGVQLLPEVGTGV